MHIGIIMNYVVPPPKYGGTNRIVANLVSQLLALGHKVTLYAKVGSYVAGARMRELPEDFEVTTYWIDSSIDIIHMHHPHRVITEIPMLVSQQGNSLSLVFPHMSFVSKSHAENHGSDIYVHNGVNLSEFPFVEKKSDYLCFLADAKWGLKNLRTAIALAHDTKTKLVVMGGEGVNSEFVEYLGMVGEAEGKLEILANAKALVYLANWDEPCAVAVLESLACGTPVIATTNGYFPEVITDSCGRCVMSYGEALDAVSGVGSYSSVACRERVMNGFTTEQMTSKYLNLYNQIVNGTWQHPIPSHNFKSRLKKVYKPTLRNFLHFEIKQRIAFYRRTQSDYSYRLNPKFPPERCNFID